MEMKILGYIPCHYGSEYLEVAIKSIEPVCDKIIILYTQNPSFSHSGQLENPDKEWQLKFIAQNASPKVEWKSYERFSHEGQHRGEIFNFSDGYDMIVTCDTDEVWDTEVLKQSLEDASKLDNRYIQVSGFVHFWKSFNHICTDGFLPVRIINLHSDNPVQGCVNGKIYHFGYAQSQKMMEFKWSGIHGHQNELREDWWDRYLDWKEGMEDLHPVAIGLWNAQPFDKTTLPDLLKNHENYNKEVI